MATRYMRGETRPVFAPVQTAQAVAVGDLAGLSGGNVVRAEDTAWASTIATPSAPTVSAVSGVAAFATGLTNAATAVKISYQFPWGEGPLSNAGTATPAANEAIKVSGAALVPPAPATYTNVYVETAAGSGIFKLYGISYGTPILVLGYGTGPVPVSGSSSDTVVTQYNFAQAFLGLSGQRKEANVARVPGNGADNVVRIDAAGIYEVDCASASFDVGAFVGAAKQTGNALESQKVVAVASEALAIGRVAQKAVNATKVLVHLLSRKLPDAPQS